MINNINFIYQSGYVTLKANIDSKIRRAYGYEDIG